MEDSPIRKSVVPIIFRVNGGATCKDRTMLVRTNSGQPATRGLFLLGGEVERVRLRCHRAIDMNRFRIGIKKMIKLRLGIYVSCRAMS